MPLDDLLEAKWDSRLGYGWEDKWGELRWEVS